MQEILVEADETESFNKLWLLWREMMDNKYKYSLDHLLFAGEHIKGLMSKFL